MSLVGLSFAQTFAFARPRPAPVRGADGAVTIAAADIPRFDHDGAGARLGLLVDAGETLGQADRCRVLPGAWESAGFATVLHELLDPAGQLIRRALYSETPRAAVDALLSSAGHHRRIGAVPGYLRNLGGYVRYRELDWLLPAAIAATPAPARAIADEAGRPLVDG